MSGTELTEETCWFCNQPLQVAEELKIINVVGDYGGVWDTIIHTACDERYWAAFRELRDDYAAPFADGDEEETR